MPSKLDALKVLAACYRVLEAFLFFCYDGNGNRGNWGGFEATNKKGLEGGVCDVSRCFGTVFCFFFCSSLRAVFCTCLPIANSNRSFKNMHKRTWEV